MALVETRHFGRAAIQLHISQSTVSCRIKQLENYYDTALFVRIRNNISLTSAGERLIGYAKLINETALKSKLELSLRDGKVQQLKLAGTPNVWDSYLHSALSDISWRFDEYSFIADFQSKDQLRVNLLNSTLDMAFTFDPIVASGVLNTKVSIIKLGLIHSGTLDANALEKYIYVDWGPPFASAQSSLVGADIIPSLRTSSSRIALKYIIKNEGAAYLPLSSIQHHIESGKLYHAIDIKEWEQSIYLNYAEINSFSHIVKFFQETTIF